MKELKLAYINEDVRLIDWLHIWAYFCWAKLIYSIIWYLSCKKNVWFTLFHKCINANYNMKMYIIACFLIKTKEMDHKWKVRAVY